MAETSSSSAHQGKVIKLQNHGTRRLGFEITADEGRRRRRLRFGTLGDDSFPKGEKSIQVVTAEDYELLKKHPAGAALLKDGTLRPVA